MPFIFSKTKLRVIQSALVMLAALPACMPGGVVDKGGRVHAPGIAPAITRTRGAPYKIVCIDPAEVRRREELPEEERRNLGPPITYLEAHNYSGGCEQTGESSVFFLFNMWPATPPLDPEYAVAAAVQGLEGDTMINITYWHETHYYSLLGTAFVFKARGDVIKFLSREEIREYERQLQQRRREQRRR